MENKILRKPLTVIFIIFLVITTSLFLSGGLLEKWAINFWALIIGNFILFFATVFSFILFRKGLHSATTGAFLRMTYGGMFLKMGICIVATLLYAFIARSHVSKAAILICFGFYFIYTFTEVKILLDQSKQNKNA